MDNLDFYREVVEKILRKYAEIPYSYSEIKGYLIIDQDRNHFMLFDIGWQQKKRVHGCVTHVQIIDHKIWVQRDGIEDGITDELVEAGIPKDKIVLGFQPPNVRHHTGYAVA
jgi:XisI protein